MFCKWCGARVDGAVCPECGRGSRAEAQGFTPRSLLFMRPVLEAFSRGRFFRAVVAGLWRVGAALTALGGLALWVLTWRVVDELPALGIVGLLLYQLLFLVGLYMVVHTQLIRAGDVDALPDSDFTVIPILSIGLRLAGEQYAIFTSVVGVGGFLLFTFAGVAGRRVMRDLPIPFVDAARSVDAGFLAGLIFLAIAFVTGMAVLFVFYFLSEALVVLVQIAKNTGVTREVAEQWDRRRAQA